MQHQIFSIRDAKAEAYMQPFYSQAKGAAIRAVADIVNDHQHPTGKHPEDYHLFHLGMWDDQTGTFELFPQPEPVCALIDLVYNNHLGDLTEQDARQIDLLKTKGKKRDA